MSTRRPAAFLDRDGVINREHGYLHRIEDFEFAPGAIEGLQALQRQGYALAVVTNQSGIARGYYGEDDYECLTTHMRTELARHGVTLAGVAHCPHLPDASVAAYRRECDCRKPAPGLVLALAAELHLDLASSILVGDKASDVQAGRAAGVGRCFLVRTGHALSAADEGLADAVFDDLSACADALARPVHDVHHAQPVEE